MFWISPDSWVLSVTYLTVLVWMSYVHRERWNLHSCGERETFGQYQSRPHSCISFSKLDNSIFRRAAYLIISLTRSAIFNRAKWLQCHSDLNIRGDQLPLLKFYYSTAGDYIIWRNNSTSARQQHHIKDRRRLSDKIWWLNGRSLMWCCWRVLVLLFRGHHKTIPHRVKIYHIKYWTK